MTKDEILNNMLKEIIENESYYFDLNEVNGGTYGSVKIVTCELEN